MYNMFFKEDFLNTLENDNTRKLCGALFSKSEKLETQLDKDIFRFNMNEVELLLYTLNVPHIASINAYVNLLRKYTDYAIEKGNRVSNINLYKTITFKDMEKYLAKHKLKYVSQEEFMNIISDIYNHVDFALYLALFEGLSGDKYSEISNLTIHDLNKAEKLDDNYYLIEVKNTNELNEDEIRKIKISNKLYKALNSAYNQEEYYTQNGEGATREILEGDYIFRNVYVSKETEVKTDKQFIYRKLNILNKLTKSALSNITTIINSGMIYYLSTLAEDNKVGAKEIEETLIKFNKTIDKNQPKTTFKKVANTHKEALKEIYNVTAIA